MPQRPTIPIIPAAPRPLVRAGAGFRTVTQADVEAVPDAASAALKGRGTAWSIAHRFERDAREAADDGWGALDQVASEEHIGPETMVVEEHAKRILNDNDSPDIPFDVSINPYRGCEHGCIFILAF